MFAFYDHVGLKNVKASDIDNEMRVHFDESPNDKEYCHEFIEMIDIAFESLTGCLIDKSKLIAIMDARELPCEVGDYYYHLLCRKYIFFKREE